MSVSTITVSSVKDVPITQNLSRLFIMWNATGDGSGGVVSGYGALTNYVPSGASITLLNATTECSAATTGMSIDIITSLFERDIRTPVLAYLSTEERTYYDTAGATWYTHGKPSHLVNMPLFIGKFISASPTIHVAALTNTNGATYSWQLEFLIEKL